MTDTKKIPFAVMAASAIALAAAYVAEYGFDLKPCTLCLYQRIPYAIAIILGLLAVALPTRARMLVALAGLAFLANAALAAFHVGVEQGWWQGLASCGGALPANATVEDLRAILSAQPVIRCDKPAFVLFGLSMAAYNGILAAGLAAATFTALQRTAK